MIYPSGAGVQGIRWAAMVDRIARSIPTRRVREPLQEPAAVTTRGRGDPQGFPPAGLRGRLPDVGGADANYFKRQASPGKYVDSRAVAQPQRGLAERNAGDPRLTHTSDQLYFGAIAADPPYARRFFTPRFTHGYAESWATNKSYGAQGVWSGPEGTLVLYPLHIPRQIGTRRAIGTATINRPSGSRRVGIPGVTVVQAAGRYP